MLSILAVLLPLTLLPAGGQNVKIVSQTCPDCGVTVYGRLLEPSDHKPGCQWYVGAETESSADSPAYSDSNSFGLIEGKPLTDKEYYELLLRTHCDYCGGEGTNHKADCIIGKTYLLWQDAMHAGQEWDAIRLRDNVVTLMLGTGSGMDKIHAMRGTAAPKPVNSRIIRPHLRKLPSASAHRSFPARWRSPLPSSPASMSMTSSMTSPKAWQRNILGARLIWIGCAG